MTGDRRRGARNGRIYRCRVIYREDDGSLRGDEDVFEWDPRLHREDNSRDYAFRMQRTMREAWERAGILCDVVVEFRPVEKWTRVEAETFGPKPEGSPSDS